MLFKTFGLAIILIVSPLISFGQVVKYTNDFLSIGVGAKYLSMGGAVFASAQGASACLWNPSTVSAYNRKACVETTYNNYFGGLANHLYIGGSYSIDTLTCVALGMVRFGVDNIQNTLHLYDENGNLDFSQISYFSVADYAFYFSYSRQFLKNFYLGANAKIIYRHQGAFANAYGFGIDLGLSYRCQQLKFGLVLRDATTTFDVWSVNKSKFDSIFVSTGNSVPENTIEQTAPSLAFSVGYQFNIWQFGVYVESGLQTWFDGERPYIISSKFASVDPCLGLELDFRKMAFLRFGLSDFQKVDSLTISRHFSMVYSMGAGFSYARFGLDYAFYLASKNSYTLNSNVFTLRVAFGS